MPYATSYGSRFLILLILRVVSMYGRHIASAEQDLPPEAVVALNTLAGLADVLAALNEPGPA